MEHGAPIKSDVNKDGWETSDFPILCETCLGDNPFVRMIRCQASKECKTCARPYTAFRWQPGRKARYKQTVICQTCAKLKNVCQTCLFDLEYGLPVEVRDKFLAESDRVDLPESRVNRDYMTAHLDKDQLGYGKVNPHPMLLRLARMRPYYKRNRSRVCTFWIRGECARGDSCPYRHELDEDHDPALADQNIKDRFMGVDDPVANKILKRAQENSALKPPEDKNITSLFLSGLPPGTTEKDIRDLLYVYGEIRSIRMDATVQHSAFVTFTTRQAAEDAAEKCFRGLIVNGARVRVAWGRSAASVPLGMFPLIRPFGAVASSSSSSSSVNPSSTAPYPSQLGFQ